MKVISLLVLLLLTVGCATKSQKTHQLKLKEMSIENITIDSLRKACWHISKGKKLYYPQYEDSGYYYIAEYYKDSLYNEIHFHIIKQDTFIFNNGKWYPQNLNLITNKQ